MNLVKKCRWRVRWCFQSPQNVSGASQQPKKCFKTLKKQPRKHKMAPYSSSAVIQVLTDPRLIWTDVIYSMFKSQIIIITVAAWAWSRVEGFKRCLFKSVWNISASGDFDYSDFLQLCTLVSLRSSRNVSFTSNPHLSFPSTQRWWDLRLIFGSASPVLLQADALFRIFFLQKLVYLSECINNTKSPEDDTTCAHDPVSNIQDF